MLHTDAISKPTLKLLKQLMADENLSNFKLAGGTALALQIGHRLSIDLDLFTNEAFNKNGLRDLLQINYQMQTDNITKNTLSGAIRNIKTDFMAHQYPVLNEVVLIDWLRMWSVQDIVAMKLNAISNRGSKKDLCIVYSLLEYYSIEQMITFYIKKYKHQQSMMVIKSLVYFEDAELEPDPVWIVKKTDWSKVKSVISSHIKKHLDQ
jgi:predicted nucleotidyltransferase component of viral defense system